MTVNVFWFKGIPSRENASTKLSNHQATGCWQCLCRFVCSSDFCHLTYTVWRIWPKEVRCCQPSLLMPWNALELQAKTTNEWIWLPHFSALLKQHREGPEKFRSGREFEPRPLRCQCSALPVKLSGQLGASRYVGRLWSRRCGDRW